MFIKPSKGRITSPFGMRTHPVTGKPSTMHWGVDYGRDGGTVIVAAASGEVTYAKSTNGYGNTIMVLHTIDGKTYETVYAHLASIGVKVGQTVKQGDVIAVMGTTGTSTGVHLHFEVHTGRWNNKFTNAKNPLLYIVEDKPPTIQTPPKKEDIEVEYEKDAKVGPALAKEFELAKKAGITDGTYPNRPGTRAEMAVMIYRATNKNK